RAAIAMSSAAEGLASRGHPLVLRTGFGLHHGELMLGTLGSPSRLETTVIGDTVNLAARIESVTKQYGSQIIVSDRVYKSIESAADISSREIDVVQVKGKSRPVVLFEVFNNDPVVEREAKLRHADGFLSGLVLFRSGDFAGARREFGEYS